MNVVVDKGVPSDTEVLDNGRVVILNVPRAVMSDIGDNEVLDDICDKAVTKHASVPDVWLLRSERVVTGNKLRKTESWSAELRGLNAE